MREPSGLKAAKFTSVSCSLNSLNSSNSSGAPSKLKAAEFTLLSCTRRTVISLPVAAYQMRAVPSADAVTMRKPSGKGGGIHTALVSAQDRDFLAGRRLPDARGLVP